MASQATIGGSAESGRPPAAAGRRLTAKGEEMRARLTAAAAEVFAEKGYEAARVADITERAGTAHGNFYRHFADKNEALLAVLRPLLEDLADATRSVERSSDPAEQLVRASTAYFHHYAANRRLLSVMREATALRSSAFQELWLSERGRFVERTRRWLERLEAEGGAQLAGDPATLAEALGALTEQLAYVQVALAPEEPGPERLDELGELCGRLWHRAVHGGPA